MSTRSSAASSVRALTVSPLTAALALLLLAAAAFQPAQAVKALSPWVEPAIMTHYGGAQDSMDPNNPSFGSKEGACGYGGVPKDVWPYFSVAALSPGNRFYQQGPLGGCGMCFQIQCISHVDSRSHPDACIKDSRGQPKSILVRITDKCPECGADHVDVQSLAFAKLMNPGLGRMNMRYRRVECTPPEDMAVSVMDFAGSNGWLRLAIDDTGGRGAVVSVYARGSNGGAWQHMTNTWGATWELFQAPAPPLDFRIATDDGEEVTATGVIKQNGGIAQGAFGQRIKFSTGVQFKITDPAAAGAPGRVQAFAGPSQGGNGDPMVVTSDTPGNDAPGSSPAPGAAPGGGPSTPAPGGGAQTVPGATAPPGCVDVPAPGAFSCQQQKDWGKCGDAIFVQNNYCARTCGRCNAAQPPAQTQHTPLPTPPVPGAGAQQPANNKSAPQQPANKPPPAGGCADVNESGFPCQQQKDWGRCNDAFMVTNNWCAATCGRCAPPVVAANGPPAGRKLLAGAQL